ncbi:hypothetical protein NDU88_000463 [Pleurodeles waltl]|uniref:Uncharacterized protein n=1 Tax=Pleurodeles waltl TaxID=8319 RepID=A0AAV7P3U0_PLEWA|nr:hypothetical protein NDU88_000463 [Pleurodeles waltl]
MDSDWGTLSSARVLPDPSGGFPSMAEGCQIPSGRLLNNNFQFHNKAQEVVRFYQHRESAQTVILTTGPQMLHLPRYQSGDTFLTSWLAPATALRSPGVLQRLFINTKGGFFSWLLLWQAQAELNMSSFVYMCKAGSGLHLPALTV